MVPRMIRTLLVAMAILVMWVPSSDAQSQPSASAASTPSLTINYDQHVKPILASKCFGCHGPRQQQSGLRLDLRQNALRGGDYGVVIVPGKADESKLILRITGSNAGLQMPPTGALEDDDVGVLRAWIDQGAEMPGRADETVVVRRTRACRHSSA